MVVDVRFLFHAVHSDDMDDEPYVPRSGSRPVTARLPQQLADEPPRAGVPITTPRGGRHGRDDVSNGGGGRVARGSVHTRSYKSFDSIQKTAFFYLVRLEKGFIERISNESDVKDSWMSSSVDVKAFRNNSFQRRSLDGIKYSDGVINY